MAWKSWEDSSHFQGAPMAHPFCLSRLDPEAGKHAVQGLSSAQGARADVKDEKRKCPGHGCTVTCPLAALKHTKSMGALLGIVRHGQGMGGTAYLALKPCTQPSTADINAGKSSGKQLCLLFLTSSLSVYNLVSGIRIPAKNKLYLWQRGQSTDIMAQQRSRKQLPEHLQICINMFGHY